MTHTATGRVSTTVTLKSGRFFVGNIDMTEHIKAIDPCFIECFDDDGQGVDLEIYYEIDLRVDRNHGTRETPDETFYEVSEVWIDGGLKTREMVAVFGEIELIANAHID
jgi:hypothetical protein